ncbi:MAG: hypothetical protein WCI73_03415 [Phycisphaerae bacterium]
MKWQTLRESFDTPLSRTRAICLRGGLSDLSMLALCSPQEHGYAWQGTTQRVGHSYEPDVQLRFATQFFGSPNGRPDEAFRDYPRFTQNRFGPDIIERELDYPALSLHVGERVFRTLQANYVWTSTWSRDAYRGRCPLRLQWLIEGGTPFKWNLQSGKKVSVLAIQVQRDGELPLYVAIAQAGKKPVECVPGADGKSIVVSLELDFGLIDSQRIAFALSCRSAREASALTAEKVARRELEKVERDWDGYFAKFRMPKVPVARTLAAQLKGSASRQPRNTYLDHAGQTQAQQGLTSMDTGADLTPQDLQFAFYKGLWHSRTGERFDPMLGYSLTETFTCYYNGTFAWSLPVAGFYAHTHYDPNWQGLIRNSMEGYRQNQLADGWLPCFIPFNYKPQPNAKASASTQIPQYAWAIWQEFLFNQDQKWLASWYQPLARYAQCMEQRDAACRNLGLWCQTHYYDGLDMFPTVDGLVIRKEPYLYSAVYAAEQVRFLQVLAKIAKLANPKQENEWMHKAAEAQQRMQEILWDQRKQWYGDVLADGHRETVIGMSGLFAAAYGLLPADAQRRKIRDNLESLITPYGVATVAPRDRRYTERFFWRGPVWPASCLYGAAAARQYAPDLLPRIAAATIRFAKAQPNVWECLQCHSGQLAVYDEGVCVMPGLSLSVVGAYAVTSTLRICAGEDLLSLEKRPR